MELRQGTCGKVVAATAAMFCNTSHICGDNTLGRRRERAHASVHVVFIMHCLFIRVQCELEDTSLDKAVREHLNAGLEAIATLCGNRRILPCGPRSNAGRELMQMEQNEDKFKV